MANLQRIYHDLADRVFNPNLIRETKANPG
jgi:hypothetical protein